VKERTAERLFVAGVKRPSVLSEILQRTTHEITEKLQWVEYLGHCWQEIEDGRPSLDKERFADAITG
jgi:hypothetical protein